jgi:protein required for attachment to host cells
MPKLTKGACVVVTDGTRAIIFENTASDGSVNLTKKDDLSPQNLDDDGPAGKRPPESSQQETDEATFAKQLANHLFFRRNRDQFDQIALVADPETLGQIRRSLHQEVSQRLVLELDKTVTNSPVSDIEASVAKALDLSKGTVD